MRTFHASAGFTLIEAIVVIVVLAILSSVVAVFISGPVNAYFQSAARAELADIADTTLRRMARDLRLAVPNSVRVTVADASTFLEFVPTLSGGQYLRRDACFTAGGCASITALAGALPNLADGAIDGNRLSLYNLNNNGAGDCADEAPSIYCNGGGANANAATITGHAAAVDGTTGSAQLTLSFANTVFHPSRGLSSPGQRFQVAAGPVTYACTPATVGDNGTGTLRRFQGYGLSAAQPTAFAGAGNLMAGNVSNCIITYADGVLGNRGLVTLWLQLMRNGERVSLFHQVHVDNTP